MPDPKHEILFRPLTVGPKTLRNRFYHSPQCSGFGSDRPGANAYHRAMKAAGGFAVVHTAWSAIHPEADQWPGHSGRIWDDSDARNLSLMVEKVHEQGALAGIQLGFNGVHAENLETRICARGVNQITSDAFPFHSCYTMTKREIRELEGFYVAAAQRARQVGFDFIQIMASSGSPIPQLFLMRLHNKRTDEYGGSIENRARFLCEVTEQVRDAVGADCAVTVRLCIDTLHDGPEGIRVDEEGAAVVQLVDPLVDLWDFEVGGRTVMEWGDGTGPSRFFPEGSQLPWIARIRRHTKKPIVNVGRFVHADQMVAALESGVVDLISMARPSIADPFLPQKIREGHTDDIRECIGCNICTSRVVQHTTIVCTQNATVGEEYRRGWHPERFSVARNAASDVLVVGAGPAGMECAMVLGKRSLRRVHLVDSQPTLGGHFNWISRLPALGEWARLTDHRKIQIDKLRNVEFIGGVPLAAQKIREYGADIVVIANGAHWAEDGLSGTTQDVIPGADASLPHVLTPEQIMVDDKPVLGERVLIYDCEGYFVGPSLAEKFAREGRLVTFVTPMAEIAPYMFYTLEGIRMNRLLHELGVELIADHVVTRVAAGLVEGYRNYAEKQRITWEADAIVLCTMRVSNHELYRELEADSEELEQEGVKALYRIGDCVVPRIAAECVFDGHRLAREIDEANPSVPLPFIRERRALGFSDVDYDSVVADRGIDWPVSSILLSS